MSRWQEQSPQPSYHGICFSKHCGILDRGMSCGGVTSHNRFRFLHITWQIVICWTSWMWKQIFYKMPYTVCNFYKTKNNVKTYITNLIHGNIFINTVEIVFVVNNFLFLFLFEYILKCHLFIWCKADFSASLLQSSVSHDPSEIIIICWFDAQDFFLIIIKCEKSSASYVCRNFKITLKCHFNFILSK